MSVSNNKRTNKKGKDVSKKRALVAANERRRIEARRHAARQLQQVFQQAGVNDLQAIYSTMALQAAFRRMQPPAQALVAQARYYVSPRFDEPVDSLPENAIALGNTGLNPHTRAIHDSFVAQQNLLEEDLNQTIALAVHYDALGMFYSHGIGLWFTPHYDEVPAKVWFRSRKDGQYVALSFALTDKNALPTDEVLTDGHEHIELSAENVEEQEIALDMIESAE